MCIYATDILTPISELNADEKVPITFCNVGILFP